MSQKAIRSALEGRLKTWSAARVPALRVAFENSLFTPVVGETYLRAYVLPADTTSEDLAGSHRAFRGLLQVSITAPITSGPGAAAGIADELGALFPVNGRYTVTGIVTQIIGPASAAPALQDEVNYTVPVSIGYRADTI